MTKLLKATVLVAVFAMLAGAAAPTFSQEKPSSAALPITLIPTGTAPSTWQQLYCNAAPAQRPGKCINKCQPGYHPGGPIYQPNNPTNSGKEPNCICILNGTTPPTPSLVHVHSVQTPQGTTIVDGDTPSDPLLTVGEQITLNGCNFGSTGVDGGTVGLETPSGSYFPVLPKPRGANWTDSTIKFTVPLYAGAQPDPAYPVPNVSSGALQVQGNGGNSNTVSLLVACPQPTIGSIGPTSVAPGGSIQLSGCGFGSSPGQISLAVPGTAVSTQSGAAPEAYVIQPGSGWSGDAITFQVPATVPPGNYTLNAQIPTITSTSTSYSNISDAPGIDNTITVTAPSPSSSSPQPSVQFGTINPQTQQFTPSQAGSTPFVSLWPQQPSSSSGLTSTGPWRTVQGESPAAPSLWATTNMQTSIPVQVENYQHLEGTVVQLMIWQDQTGPLTCDPNGPSDQSPDGNKGSWQPIGSAQAIPEGPPQTIQIPVSLNPGVNYLALGGGLGNLMTYHPTVTTAPCPADGGPSINPGNSPSTYPNNMIGQWVQPVIVLPVYTVTLDALPYTIIYEPPGDQSNSKVVDTITSSIQYKIGAGSKTSNSSNDVNNTCESASLSVAGLGPSYESCDQTSETTQNDFAQQWTNSQQIATTGSNTYNVGPVTSLIPDPPSSSSAYQSWGSDYANEPFWYDGFVFLMNPQYAVYNDNGAAVFRLLPNYLPTYSQPVPLALLAACAAGLPTPIGPGFPVAGNPCAIGNFILTPSEALSALGLDPFYPNGQSQDPTGGCVASATTACRILPSSSQDYGEDQNSILVSFQVGQQQTGEYDTTNTYTATATGVQKTTLGFKDDLSQTITAINGIGSSGGSSGGSSSPVSATIGISNESSNTQTTIVAVNYTVSTIASTSQTYLDTVTLADDDAASTVGGISCKAATSPCHAKLAPEPTGFTPTAYWDSMFGTLLFRDPYAPGPPAGNYTEQMKKILPGILGKMQPYLQLHAGTPIRVSPKTKTTPAAETK